MRIHNDNTPGMNLSVLLLRLLTGEGHALPRRERLEQSEHPERVGGPLRSGPRPMGPLHRVVPVELHSADEGGGVGTHPTDVSDGGAFPWQQGPL